jgi:hypothetical protein
MERDKIARIIRALLEKTTERGATEAEAMTAAAKARELMDRYQIDAGTAGLEEEGTSRLDVGLSPYRGLGIRNRIAVRVAQFCDCKVWKVSREGKLFFFGMASDVEFAGWLIASLDGFIRQASLQFLVSQPKADARTRWVMQKAFIIGATTRISERLEELSASRKSEPLAGDGRSLVVVKGAIVARDFAKLGMRLGGGRKFQNRVGDGGAFYAGQAAGDRASFGRPVSSPGGGGIALIGRS